VACASKRENEPSDSKQWGKHHGQLRIVRFFKKYCAPWSYLVS